MNQLTRLFVWLSRLHHSRGFGIQSPTDYQLVRYVINEHWPYYRYADLGRNDNWLRHKTGLLCFRLANWRQPHTIVSNDYADYWQAGCRQAALTQDMPSTVELMLADISEADGLADKLRRRVDEHSVVVVDGLWRNKEAWRQLVDNELTTVAFDLYYCGLLTFDPKRTKQHYIINF